MRLSISIMDALSCCFLSSVTVVARVEKISNTVDAEYKSSGPGVSFHRIPYYEGPSGFTKKENRSV